MVERAKPKKSPFRHFAELRDLRATVRVLASEGKDPTTIAKEIRDHPYIVRALAFAGKKQSPRPKFEYAQVAAAVLVPWLPEKIARPLLRELFDVKNIWRSIKRFEPTGTAIMEAAEWILESGFRATHVLETMRKSGQRWKRMRRLLPADGFFVKLPPFGFRRPRETDTPLPWTMSDLQPALRHMVEQDPKLENTLRMSFELRMDEKQGPELDELASQIIRGWNVNTAARKLRLPYKSVSFSTLLRDPVLYGKRPERRHSKDAQLWEVKTDKSPLTREKFELLQKRIPPLGVSQLVGLLWDFDAWIGRPDGALLVEDIYTLHVDLQMGYDAIAMLTGLSRASIAKMFQRTEYIAVVGEDRFLEGVNASTLHRPVSAMQARWPRAAKLPAIPAQ